MSIDRELKSTLSLLHANYHIINLSSFILEPSRQRVWEDEAESDALITFANNKALLSRSHQNCDAEWGTSMGNGFLPCNCVPSWLQCCHRAKAPLSTLWTTCSVFVSSVVKGDVLSTFIKSITRTRALPSSMCLLKKTLELRLQK